MIYTCTLNPSIDFFVDIEQLNLGGVNRMTREAKIPGGKGINVSRVLKGLGIENKALGFIGGFTGQFIKDALELEGIKTDFVKVGEDSRINIKLRAEQETEINGAGPEISIQARESFLNKLAPLEAGDVLVLAGSIPQSLPDSLYQDIIKHFSEKQVKVVVDATKQLLMGVVPHHPFLIKPNHIELGELFGVTINTPEETILYGKKLIDMGAQNVIVSMAAQGNVLFTKDKIYFANVPKGELKNSVGAGDSVVAGFIASYVNNGDIVEAFRYGATAGSASAYSEGFCTEEFISQLITEVNVKELREKVS